LAAEDSGFCAAAAPDVASLCGGLGDVCESPAACCVHAGNAQSTRTKMTTERNCFRGLRAVQESEITGVPTESPYCICISSFTLFASFSICAFAALKNEDVSLPPAGHVIRQPLRQLAKFVRHSKVAQGR
jgi:hypothetical protein